MAGGLRITVRGPQLGLNNDISFVSICTQQVLILSQATDRVEFYAPACPDDGLADVVITSENLGTVLGLNLFRYNSRTLTALRFCFEFLLGSDPLCS